jgi:hypothetical protein
MFATVSIGSTLPNPPYPIGTLKFYTYSTPWQALPARLTASFELPTCIQDLQPSFCFINQPSATHLGSTSYTSPMVYEQAYDRQWLQLELVLDIYDDIVLQTRANLCLCILPKPLNAMVEPLFDIIEQPILSVPWEAWARHTCWIRAGSLVGPNSASGWGSKLASLTLDELLRNSILTIYDLGPPKFSTTNGTGQIFSEPIMDKRLQDLFVGSRQLVGVSSFAVGGDLETWGSETGSEHGHPEVIVDGDYGAL